MMLFDDRNGDLYKKCKAAYETRYEEEPTNIIVLRDAKQIDLEKRKYVIEEERATAYSQFRSACSQFGDLLELFLLFRQDGSNPFPPDMAMAWVEYIKFFNKNSPGFRSYVDETRTTWTPAFLEYFPQDKKK